MKITHPLNTKPEYSVGDIFRQYGDIYDKSHAMSPEQCKVLRTLSKCRTSELGGHLYQCEEDGCGYEIPVYNSCRDRHCPLCQGIAMRKWLAKRMEELLPVPYYHTIFTISHGFDVLIPYNERLFYDALFEAASLAVGFKSPSRVCFRFQPIHMKRAAASLSTGTIHGRASLNGSSHPAISFEGVWRFKSQ